METRLIILVVTAVAVSGCTAPGGTDQGSTGSEGLKITKFKAADNSLRPGQETFVEVIIKNHHTQEIEVEDVSLFNTAFLKVNPGEEKETTREASFSSLEKVKELRDTPGKDTGKETDEWKKHCNPDSLEPARKGKPTKMRCSWRLKAPEDLSGFRSKAVTINLNLEYSAQLSNSENPLKLRFKPLSKIDSSSEISHTYSNGEVKMAVSGENPVATGESMFLDFKLEPVGKGRVTSNYEMSYSPGSIFQDCKKEVEPLSGEKAEFSCEIMSGKTTTRNLIFSTSYKYNLSPSLDIEVVKS